MSQFEILLVEHAAKLIVGYPTFLSFYPPLASLLWTRCRYLSSALTFTFFVPLFAFAVYNSLGFASVNLTDVTTARAERVLAAPLVGVERDEVVVKELGYHWASCGVGGALNFHWKTLMAPQTVIDYIVVHELCHLRHRDHSGAFWNEVDNVLPRYRERKEWLRRNGAALDI
ncbi:M48 family metallopeptidase [Bradyrhizobium sp. 200]|uniref:M48 metallopeptidase family protein n=1 Tax=Bradyrhizobium sp. 200 TaxID=2782665 RepID=UPI001FFF4329|nr:M48 family metallopeptidase [Bradyrhizobium sp. 200]